MTHVERELHCVETQWVCKSGCLLWSTEEGKMMPLGVTAREGGRDISIILREVPAAEGGRCVTLCHPSAEAGLPSPLGWMMLLWVYHTAASTSWCFTFLLWPPATQASAGWRTGCAPSALVNDRNRLDSANVRSALFFFCLRRAGQGAVRPTARSASLQEHHRPEREAGGRTVPTAGPRAAVCHADAADSTGRPASAESPLSHQSCSQSGQRAANCVVLSFGHSYLWTTSKQRKVEHHERPVTVLLYLLVWNNRVLLGFAFFQGGPWVSWGDWGVPQAWVFGSEGGLPLSGHPRAVLWRWHGHTLLCSGWDFVASKNLLEQKQMGALTPTPLNF